MFNSKLKEEFSRLSEKKKNGLFMKKKYEKKN